MRVMILLVAFVANTALAATPAITLKTEAEEEKKMIVATVTVDGKPVEGAAVSFYVERTFGNLLIGEDKTLDDGTAAVNAPNSLPGGPNGKLRIIAQAALSNQTGSEPTAATEVPAPSMPSEPAAPAAPPEQKVVRAQLAIEGTAKKVERDAFPRALWSPRAPIPLLVTITGILAVVWGTYAFVVFELVKIKQGAKS